MHGRAPCVYRGRSGIGGRYARGAFITYRVAQERGSLSLQQIEGGVVLLPSIASVLRRLAGTPPSIEKELRPLIFPGGPQRIRLDSSSPPIAATQEDAPKKKNGRKSLVIDDDYSQQTENANGWVLLLSVAFCPLTLCQYQLGLLQQPSHTSRLVPRWCLAAEGDLSGDLNSHSYRLHIPDVCRRICRGTARAEVTVPALGKGLSLLLTAQVTTRSGRLLYACPHQQFWPPGEPLSAARSRSTCPWHAL